METLGNDITDLPLTAAIVVAVVSSTIVIVLSLIGIPASFVVIATFCIVGLGWGRATRTMTIADVIRRDSFDVPVSGLRMDDAAPSTADGRSEDGTETADAPVGEGPSDDIPPASDLFDPTTTIRVVAMQLVVPVVATVGSFLTFQYLITV
jgi:PiT family inorganic phosphate transporter